MRIVMQWPIILNNLNFYLKRKKLKSKKIFGSNNYPLRTLFGIIEYIINKSKIIFWVRNSIFRTSMHPYMTYKKYLFLYLPQSRVCLMVFTNSKCLYIHIYKLKSVALYSYLHIWKNVLTVIQFQETMSSFFLTTTTVMAQ